MPMRSPAEGSNHQRLRAAGFTLTEMLIVIGIIVMVVMLAIPAFRIMSGGRSVEAAANQLSALAGRARAEAIGLQETTGIFFYMDAATERVSVAILHEVPAPADAFVSGTIFLDALPNRDSILFPNGVDAHTLISTYLQNGVRQDDGYFGFGPLYFTDGSHLDGRIGNCILFDGHGRLTVKVFQLLLVDRHQPTQTMKLFYGPDKEPPASFSQNTLYTQPVASAVGVAMFDKEAFVNARLPSGGVTTEDDRQITNGTYTQAEREEETWLDENAVPYLVNRYAGTLVRAE